MELSSLFLLMRYEGVSGEIMMQSLFVSRRERLQ